MILNGCAWVAPARPGGANVGDGPPRTRYAAGHLVPGLRGGTGRFRPFGPARAVHAVRVGSVGSAGSGRLRTARTDSVGSDRAQARRGLIVRAVIEVAAGPAPLAVCVAVTSSAWSATMSSTPSTSGLPGGVLPTAASSAQQSSSVASPGASSSRAKGLARTFFGSRPTGSPCSTSGAKYFTSRTTQVDGL